MGQGTLRGDQGEADAFCAGRRVQRQDGRFLDTRIRIYGRESQGPGREVGLCVVGVRYHFFHRFPPREGERAIRSGPSLLEHLDKLPMVDRKMNSPVMIPISEKYKDMGTIAVGKLESGHIRKGDTLLLMPNRDEVEVAAMYNELEEEVNMAVSGDNVRIRLRSAEDDDISPGFVLTSPLKPVHAVRLFEAQLAILDHKNIICAGYSAVMHVHTLAEEVTLSVRTRRLVLLRPPSLIHGNKALLHYFDKTTGRKSRKPPQFAKRGQRIVALIEATAPICVERFVDYPQLGRFTLRDEGTNLTLFGGRFVDNSSLAQEKPWQLERFARGPIMRDSI